MSALLFSIAVTWWIKHFGQNGHAEYELALAREAATIRKAHPDWSQRRVRRHAKKATRSYWWNQAIRGFPDIREAREADREAAQARWAEEQLATFVRRRDAWRRIRDAKAEWDRLHDEERQAREGDTTGPEPAPAREADTAGPEPAPAQEDTGGQDRPEVVDAEIVDAEIVDDEPPTPQRPPAEPSRPALDRPADPAPTAPQAPSPKPSAPSEPSPGTAQAPRAVPAQPNIPAAPVPAPAGSSPAPDAPRPIPSGPTPPVEEGDSMAPRPPGLPVPRNGSVPARRSSPDGGEAWTHGQFEKSTADVQGHADAVPPLLEQMLGNLRAVEAGRSQVAGVMWGYERIGAFAQEVQRMLDQSNRRARPMVTAVDSAGGPNEIANIGYYQRV